MSAAEKRPPRAVSLLGQRPELGEIPPSGQPQPGAERADGDGSDRPSRGDAGGRDPLRSAHSTFRDLEPPRDDFDAEKARALCAEIARDALLDFAPALVLLPAAMRARAQAALAYARTLLDFARDRSLEGERLAQINRFEFTLEAALGGDPPGQPVFVQLAALERAAPWPRSAFDELASVARSRVSIGLPKTERAAEAQRRRLARAMLHLVLGEPPAGELEAMGAALLRAASLLHWRDSLWFHRPELGLGSEEAPTARFREAIAAEREAIAAALEESAKAAIAGLSRPLRPAARYARLAAEAITKRAARSPDSPSPPRIGAWPRLGLLVRARFAGRDAARPSRPRE